MRKLVKLLFISIIQFAFNDVLIAQQPSQYSLYHYNLYTVNPAYAGHDDFLSANASVKQQWTGFDGVPQFQNLNVQLPIERYNSGVGINIENDKLGAQQNFQVGLTYAYKLTRKISFGISGTYYQIGWNGASIRTPDGNYQSGIDHKDQTLSNSTFTGNTILADAGLLYHTNIIKIGLGVKNLTRNSLKYTINNGKIRLVTNYFFTFAADLFKTKVLKIVPSALFKTDLIENQLDINLNNEIFEKYFINLGYRGLNKKTNDAIVLGGGLRLNEKLTLFYAYDYNISALKSSNTGSHEILLKYQLNKPIGKSVPEKIIYNARYY